MTTTNSNAQQTNQTAARTEPKSELRREPRGRREMTLEEAIAVSEKELRKVSGWLKSVRMLVTSLDTATCGSCDAQIPISEARHARVNEKEIVRCRTHASDFDGAKTYGLAKSIEIFTGKVTAAQAEVDRLKGKLAKRSAESREDVEHEVEKAKYAALTDRDEVRGLVKALTGERQTHLATLNRLLPRDQDVGTLGIGEIGEMKKHRQVLIDQIKPARKIDDTVRAKFDAVSSRADLEAAKAYAGTPGVTAARALIADLEPKIDALSAEIDGLYEERRQAQRALRMAIELLRALPDLREQGREVRKDLIARGYRSSGGQRNGGGQGGGNRGKGNGGNARNQTSSTDDRDDTVQRALNLQKTRSDLTTQEAIRMIKDQDAAYELNQRGAIDTSDGIDDDTAAEIAANGHYSASPQPSRARS
ncbi:hypothetical protein HY632_02810 [Candidatus Uhrbacteria bacterium]|nr:hypothetical protein [Candidatus Uhrbacteria bacterium]